MRNFWSILAVYLVAWVIFFVYFATVRHRVARLENDFRRLKERVSSKS